MKWRDPGGPSTHPAENSLLRAVVNETPANWLPIWTSKGSQTSRFKTMRHRIDAHTAKQRNIIRVIWRKFRRKIRREFSSSRDSKNSNKTAGNRLWPSLIPIQARSYRIILRGREGNSVLSRVSDPTLSTIRWQMRRRTPINLSSDPNQPLRRTRKNRRIQAREFDICSSRMLSKIEKTARKLNWLAAIQARTADRQYIRERILIRIRVKLLTIIWMGWFSSRGMKGIIARSWYRVCTRTTVVRSRNAVIHRIWTTAVTIRCEIVGRSREMTVQIAIRIFHKIERVPNLHRGLSGPNRTSMV